MVSLRSVALDARLYFIGTDSHGRRVRLDADGSAHGLSPQDLKSEAHLLGGPVRPPPELLNRGDDYYYSTAWRLSRFLCTEWT
jgi:hypothetical protein